MKQLTKSVEGKNKRRHDKNAVRKVGSSFLDYLSSSFFRVFFSAYYGRHCRCDCLRHLHLCSGMYCKMRENETESISGCQDSNGDTNCYCSVSDHTGRCDPPSNPASAIGEPASFPNGIKSLPTPSRGFCSCAV